MRAPYSKPAKDKTMSVCLFWKGGGNSGKVFIPLFLALHIIEGGLNPFYLPVSQSTAISSAIQSGIFGYKDWKERTFASPTFRESVPQ